PSEVVVFPPPTSSLTPRPGAGQDAKRIPTALLSPCPCGRGRVFEAPGLPRPGFADSAPATQEFDACARAKSHPKPQGATRTGGTTPMKAAYLETTGGPEVIRYGDLPKPTPKQGEVLVKVGAVALNPIDLYIRSGMVAMPLPKPYIPGCDLAGTVEAVG